MNKKIEKFSSAKYFKCPICNEKLLFNNLGSLKCLNNHNFDISAKGYLNFIMNRKENTSYTKDFFVNRNIINQQGFYKHILDELISIIKLDDNNLIIADLGCGEGYYASNLSNYFNNIYAFDYSKEAINFACKQSDIPFWSVADIASIPLQNRSVDLILNIFSPANYNEFNRILKDNGLLIKIVPTSSHFTEFREALDIEEYSNKDIVEYFKNHFNIIKEISVSETLPITREQLKSLLKMTPIAFNYERVDINDLSIDNITIAATILIGKKK